MPRPLDFQMGVEDEILRQLRKVLEIAAKEIEQELNISNADEKVGQKVSRAQAEAILKATRAHLDGDWRSIEDALSQSRKLSAMAAVEAFYDQMSGPMSELLGDSGLESLVRSQAAAAATRIDTVVARLTESKRSLSQQVWKTKALSNGWLGNKVNSALARGWDAKRLAKEVVSFVNPDVPGGASYAAMRLARTEINNAFHAQTLQSMADSGVVEYVKWNLSRSHPDRDICDELAEHRLGEDIPGQPTPPEPEPMPKSQEEKFQEAFGPPTKRKKSFEAMASDTPLGRKGDLWEIINREVSRGVVDHSGNCTRVSMATEMYARGYDMIPGWSQSGNADNAQEKRTWWDKWRTADGAIRTPETIYSHEEFLFLQEELPEGARYLIAGAWKDGGAHIWNFEVKNGQAVMYEGQVKTSGEEDRYLDRLGEINGEFAKIMRVDDMFPISEVLIPSVEGDEPWLRER